MTIELGLLPSGHLKCISEPEKLNLISEAASQTLANKTASYETETTHILEKAFSTHQAAGLFVLAGGKINNKSLNQSTTQLTASIRFWQSYVNLYMTERCHTPDTETGSITALPFCLSAETCNKLILEAPPMMGGEYLSAEVFNLLWTELDTWLCQQVANMSVKFTDFLTKEAPKWRQVGRVCFHLVENKNDPEFPFAFLVTYAASLSTQGKSYHKPLNKALEEYAGTRNKKALINLLSPIQLASESSLLIKELIDSGDIYHPLAWSPNECYQFLGEVALYEQCGIVVRIPDWWKKRSRPKVTVKLGNESSNLINGAAMLNFNVELALGNQSLSEKEWQQLMQADDGLFFLKGQWVEVDKEKLSAALTHWQSLEQQFQDNGISFIEGMRLLAEIPVDLSATAEDIDHNWSMVTADKNLAKLLQAMRQPESLKSAKPGRSLKTSLRDYQSTGVNWLLHLSQLGLGACLADDMGLGKTIQIIALLLIIKQKNNKKKATQPSQPTNNISSPSLLVLPASLLHNWKNEIKKFAPSLNCLYLHPSITSKTDITTLADNGSINNQPLTSYDLVLTSYGMLKRQHWLIESNWNLVILDEAQAIKNPNTNQTKTVKQVKANTRIALTGTPIENRLSDLWSLFDFINPGLLGNASKFKKFTKLLAAREHHPYAPLKQLIQPYILRRLKTDKSIISDLPDKTEVHAYCGLSKAQASLYQKAVQQLTHALKTNQESRTGIKRRGLVLSYLMRFKQICNHPAQVLDDGEFHAKDSGKFIRLQALCEEIASRQEKVLIFTQFREITEPLTHFLQSVFKAPGLMLDGSTAVKKRQQLVDQFQSEDGPNFFVLSIKAGGTGLNLTAASHVIHFDRWWNPAVENQATDRAYRIGQKRNVLVHKFVCQGTIEEKIDAMIREKTALANDLLDGAAETLLTEMSDEALLDLVKLDIDQVQI